MSITSRRIAKLADDADDDARVRLMMRASARGDDDHTRSLARSGLRITYSIPRVSQRLEAAENAGLGAALEIIGATSTALAVEAFAAFAADRVLSMAWLPLELDCDPPTEQFAAAIRRHDDAHDEAAERTRQLAAIVAADRYAHAAVQREAFRCAAATVGYDADAAAGAFLRLDNLADATRAAIDAADVNEPEVARYAAIYAAWMRDDLDQARALTAAECDTQEPTDTTEEP
jgi:hypothetical protein